MSVTILGPLAKGEWSSHFTRSKSQRLPAPAADHLEHHISINELLDIRAPHIYLVRIEGHSTEGAGIFDGDMAVVDRSIAVEDGHIVIAAVNWEPMRKHHVDDAVICLAANAIQVRQTKE
ncbi:S24 family peptidase [Pseudomonas mohnii]